MDLAFLLRKIEHINEALNIHAEVCDNSKDCVRCKNLEEKFEEVYNETPNYILFMVRVSMWITHPIQMIRHKGDIRKVTD